MKTVVRRKFEPPKGPAQPASRRNKRKARQDARQGGHKRRRKERREMAEQYNAAREIVERDMAEAAEVQAETVARLETEPKFDITDAFGNVMVSGVPESLIRPQPVEELTPSDIYVPITSDAAKEREALND
jgi:hypothetical protein